MSKSSEIVHMQYSVRKLRAVQARLRAELDEDTMRHRHVNSEHCVVCTTLRRIWDPDGIEKP